LLIGNQQHFARQRAFLVVERLEFFPGRGAADDDGWLAFRLWRSDDNQTRAAAGRFEHDVIRHVHDVADAADADFFQGGAQPIRAGPDLSRL
jgi:hypothetical protein